MQLTSNRVQCRCQIDTSPDTFKVIAQWRGNGKKKKRKKGKQTKSAIGRKRVNYLSIYISICFFPPTFFLVGNRLFGVRSAFQQRALPRDQAGKNRAASPIFHVPVRIEHTHTHIHTHKRTPVDTYPVWQVFPWSVSGRLLLEGSTPVQSSTPFRQALGKVGVAVLSISYTFPKPTAMEQLFKFSNKMGVFFLFGSRSALTFTRNERTIGKKLGVGGAKSFRCF